MSKGTIEALNYANIALINLKSIIDIAAKGALEEPDGRMSSVLCHISSSLDSIKKCMEAAEMAVQHD
jgi:hypothetical protein